jgi:DNA uptake protein ComE-like DNA-binding protein
MRRNGHIKESYSPTASKENKRCNELLHTNKLLKKQNKGRKLSTANKCTNMHVSLSLMNEINAVSNNY